MCMCINWGLYYFYSITWMDISGGFRFIKQLRVCFVLLYIAGLVNQLISTGKKS